MTDTFAIPNPDSLRPVMLRVWEAVNAEVKGEQEAVQVVIKKMSKRSAEANALMWLRLHELAAQTDCHQGPSGIHGDRSLLRIAKCEELDLLADTIEKVAA